MGIHTRPIMEVNETVNARGPVNTGWCATRCCLFEGGGGPLVLGRISMQRRYMRRTSAHVAYCVSMARERQGLDRDELHVNLGCLRKCAKVAGI
jgi:hypothetical protein